MPTRADVWMQNLDLSMSKLLVPILQIDCILKLSLRITDMLNWSQLASLALE